MADPRDVRAGLFVVLALVILVAGTVWILGYTPFAGDRAGYEVLTKGSSGIRRGDRMRVAGIEAGRVEAVELRAGQAWPVVFHIALDRGVTLTQGSSARITTDGLLGAPYLEVVAGPADAAPLPPGSRIYGDQGGDLMSTLAELGDTTDKLPVLVDQATSLLATLNREIQPLLAGLQGLLAADNVDALSRGMKSLSRTLDELGPQLPPLIGRLESLADRLEEGLAGLPDLTADARGLLGDLRTALGTDGERLSGLLGSAEETLGSTRETLSAVQREGPQLDAMVRDLRAAAANLRALSQDLKERPSLVLRSPEAPEHRPGEGAPP